MEKVIFMATQTTIKNKSLTDKVIADIEKIYLKGFERYLLWNYVPRDFWTQSFQELFPDKYVYNETDFNYSVCFTTYVHISPINKKIGTKGFREYIETNGYLDLLVVDISALAPYALVKYVQYRFINNEYMPFSSYAPFKEEHQVIGDKVKAYLQDKGITFLEDDILFEKVNPEISLENREDDVRVYNCLFDDSDTWPKRE